MRPSPSLRRFAPAALLLGAFLLPGADRLRAQAPPDVGLPVAPVHYDDDGLPPSFHADRRAAVLDSLPENAVAILFAAPERNRSNDTNYEYRQDSDFFYLTGSQEPGSVLLLAPGGMEIPVTGAEADGDGGTERVRELLFVPPRDPAEEVWTGRRLGTERAEERSGVRRALENTRFAEVAGPILADQTHRVYHEDLPDGVSEGSDLHAQLRLLREMAGSSGLVDGPPTREPDGRMLRQVLTGLREIKTADEIRLLERAAEITADAHRAVMREVEPGWAEYEMEALVEYTFKREGAEHPGFNSIIGSGENSVILHYEANRRVTEPGDVVVLDIGAEYRGYSADVTRTLPVNGSFSPEQRRVYDIVLKAQQAGIDASRAGAGFAEVSAASVRVVLEGLAALGLIDGPRDIEGMRRFLMHGISHYVGLDVHDTGTYTTLRPGMVITVEPGIYIAPAEDIDPRWWNIGVRIEDDVLITEDGPRLLSDGAPREAEAVERLMAGG